MKKILQSNYTAFYEDFNIPNVADDEMLVKTHYSFISTGTESVNLITHLIMKLFLRKVQKNNI